MVYIQIICILIYFISRIFIATIFDCDKIMIMIMIREDWWICILNFSLKKGIIVNCNIGILTFPFGSQSHIFATNAPHNSLRIMSPRFVFFLVIFLFYPNAEPLFSSIVLLRNTRMYATQPRNGKGVGIFITNRSATICERADRYLHSRIAAGRTFVLFRWCFNLATAVKEFQNFYHATFIRQK